MYMVCENMSLPKIKEKKEVFISKQSNDIHPKLPKLIVNGEGITR